MVVTMGRKAGHLALGIGKAAGATLTLVPEEFPQDDLAATRRRHRRRRRRKRLSDDRPDGVAVIAEGLLERLRPEDLALIDNGERDQHDNIVLGEMNLGAVLKQRAQAALRAHGVSTPIIAKTIGYELRCADPIPYDMEYTRDLGYCAARYLIEGGTGVMVSMQGGRFIPVKFEKLIDLTNGRAKVRLLDVDSDRYRIAHDYMVRLRRKTSTTSTSSRASPRR
ncbi:MAG: 6-phosphofructokinase [Polyangiales bacterium]